MRSVLVSSMSSTSTIMPTADAKPVMKLIVFSSQPTANTHTIEVLKVLNTHCRGNYLKHPVKPHGMPFSLVFQFLLQLNLWKQLQPSTHSNVQCMDH